MALPVCFPSNLKDEQAEIAGRHRAVRDMFDDPLLELLDSVEVEHWFCNETLHSFIERLDVQARNMRDLPVLGSPSLFLDTSQLQDLGECLYVLQSQCTPPSLESASGQIGL